MEHLHQVLLRVQAVPAAREAGVLRVHVRLVHPGELPVHAGTCVATQGSKYGYYALARNYFDRHVLMEKYEGESRRLKLESVLKLSYDSLFYLCTSAVAFVLFRQEPWFPNWVGGSGKCENIFMNYPAIPSAKKSELEMFYALQLGVHLFSVFEMVALKRKTEQKYYEKLLHHMLAASLIGFSAMTNEVLIGVMVLFTHDFSDVFMAFGRTVIETKHKKV